MWRKSGLQVRVNGWEREWWVGSCSERRRQKPWRGGGWEGMYVSQKGAERAEGCIPQSGLPCGPRETQTQKITQKAKIF